jgi:MFS family permease
VTSAPALYTPEFLRACGLHFAGAMSLAMFMLFPLYVKEIGGTEATIGLLLGVGTAASVAARPIVGVVLDRVGRRQVLLWCGAGNVLSWIPFMLLTGVGPALYVWTVLHDVMWGALFTAYFTYVADLVPPTRRAEGIAIFGVAGMSANGLAPILGERVIDASGFDALFGVAMAFGLVSLAATLLVPAVGPRPTDEQPASLRDIAPLARHPRLVRVMLATAVLGIAINAAYLFVAPYTRIAGLTRAWPFFAAYSATSVIIRLFGRRMLDVLGAHRVSGPGFLVYAAGLAGLTALPTVEGTAATWLLAGCGMACGAGHGSLFPVLNALVVARAPAGKQGAVIGLHTAAIDAGAVLGMPLCGVIAEALGYPAMYGVTALACLFGLVLMVRDGGGEDDGTRDV